MTAVIGGYPWRVPSQQNDYDKPTRCFQLPDPYDLYSYESMRLPDSYVWEPQPGPYQTYWDQIRATPAPTAVQSPNRAERRKSKWQKPEVQEEVPAPVVFPWDTVLPWDTLCTACGLPLRVSTRGIFDFAIYGHNRSTYRCARNGFYDDDAALRRILAGPRIIDDFTTPFELAEQFPKTRWGLKDYMLESPYAYARPVAA